MGYIMQRTTLGTFEILQRTRILTKLRCYNEFLYVEKKFCETPGELSLCRSPWWSHPEMRQRWARRAVAQRRARPRGPARCTECGAVVASNPALGSNKMDGCGVNSGTKRSKKSKAGFAVRTGEVDLKRNVRPASVGRAAERGLSGSGGLGDVTRNNHSVGRAGGQAGSRMD